MLDQQTIDTEIATLNEILDGLGDQKVRVLIVTAMDALKWVLQCPHGNPPSKVLALLKETRPYPLSADLHSDAELN